MNFHRLFICSYHFDVSILFYAISQRPDYFLLTDLSVEAVFYLCILKQPIDNSSTLLGSISQQDQTDRCVQNHSWTLIEQRLPKFYVFTVTRTYAKRFFIVDRYIWKSRQGDWEKYLENANTTFVCTGKFQEWKLSDHDILFIYRQ